MRFVGITVASFLALSFAPAVAAPKTGETIGVRPDAAERPPTTAGKAAQTKALQTVAPPLRATTPNEKIERLKLAGVNATIGQLGTSYRLDMPTPTTSVGPKPQGFLELSMAATSHAQGGFAWFASQVTITDPPANSVVPAVQIRLLFDATRVQLIDCQVDPEGMQLEFEHAITYLSWANKATVTATSGHVFYVIPSGPPTHYSDVRLRAAAQNPGSRSWRFFGCEITPVG